MTNVDQQRWYEVNEYGKTTRYVYVANQYFATDDEYTVYWVALSMRWANARICTNACDMQHHGTTSQCE